MDAKLTYLKPLISLIRESGNNTMIAVGTDYIALNLIVLMKLGSAPNSITTN